MEVEEMITLEEQDVKTILVELADVEGSSFILKNTWLRKTFFRKKSFS